MTQLPDRAQATAAPVVAGRPAPRRRGPRPARRRRRRADHRQRRRHRAHVRRVDGHPTRRPPPTTTCGGSTSSWDDQASRYLSARAVVPDDSYALRDIPDGELVPASAVGARSTVTVQPSRSRSTPGAARGLPAGALVDVWVSPRDTQSTQERYLDATLALERVVSPGHPGLRPVPARRRRRWPFSCRSRATRSPRSSPPSTSSRGSPWCRSRARAPRDACPHGAREPLGPASRPSSRPRAVSIVRRCLRICPTSSRRRPPAPSHSSPATCAVST